MSPRYRIRILLVWRASTAERAHQLLTYIHDTLNAHVSSRKRNPRNMLFRPISAQEEATCGLQKDVMMLAMLGCKLELWLKA